MEKIFLIFLLITFANCYQEEKHFDCYSIFKPSVSDHWCETNCYDGAHKIAPACDPKSGVHQRCVCNHPPPPPDNWCYSMDLPEVTTPWCKQNCYNSEGDLIFRCDKKAEENQICQCAYPEIKNKTTVCIEGRKVKIDYDVNMAFDPSLIYNVDELDGFNSVTCSESTVEITFKNSSDAAKYQDIFEKPGNLLQDVNTRCPSIFQNMNNTFFPYLMRFTQESRMIGNTLHVLTSEGKYEDIWYNANVSIYQTYEKCNTTDLGFEKDFCIGANTDANNLNCEEKMNIIPLYDSNENSPSDIKCANCFVGMDANFFTEFSWAQTGKVNEINGASFQQGMKKIVFKTGVELDISAKKKINSVSQTQPLNFWNQKTVINEKIGDTPIKVEVSIPVDTTLKAELKEIAQANAGLSGTYTVGDYWTKYTKGKGWEKKVPSNPTYSVTGKTVQGDKKSDFTADFKFTPKIQYNVPGISWMQFTLDHSIDNTIAGKDTEICETIKRNDGIDITTQLFAGVGILKNEAKHYGPLNVWKSPEETITDCEPYGKDQDIQEIKESTFLA